MVEIIIHIIGYAFLWAAIDTGRNEESEIKRFSKDWWVIVLFLVIGAILLKK